MTLIILSSKYNFKSACTLYTLGLKDSKSAYHFKGMGLKTHECFHTLTVHTLKNNLVRIENVPTFLRRLKSNISLSYVFSKRMECMRLFVNAVEFIQILRLSALSSI